MNKAQIEIIKSLNKLQQLTERDFLYWNRKIAMRYKLPPQSKNQLRAIYQQLLQIKEIKANPRLAELLKVRATRSLSGVTPVTVLTKPYPCPGKCIYCPLEPGMPKSYLSTEPGAMRAVANKFDPYLQVHNRMRALLLNGHQPDKIELLVLGGTWSAYPWDYQRWFIKRCLEAVNYFPYKIINQSVPKKMRSFTLAQAQHINETAPYRVIGITLETRPDWVTEKETRRLRDLGCTRVQLGIQILDDKILDLIVRGHHIEDSIVATRRLRENGFKIDHHIMQNLPGATPASDQTTLERIFADPDFRPDQIKIYPTIVSKYAPLHQWWLSGKYKPYPAKKLFDLLLELKQTVPYYCRINRLIRDFPEQSIQAGNKVTNLREMLQAELKKRNLRCHCIRCREARNQNSNLSHAKLFIEKYIAGKGKEFFISYENKERTAIYGFVRLRLNSKENNTLFPEIKHAALTRELHVYGELVGHMSKNKNKVQHRGLGMKLMKHAEKIAKKEGYKKMAVIAGIGVRQYYRKKLDYRLQGTYMVKSI
jgi:elongator complex protein 3